MNNLQYMELYDFMWKIVYLSNKFHLISTHISKTFPATVYCTVEFSTVQILSEKISSLGVEPIKLEKEQRNYFRALSVSCTEGAHVVLLRRLDNEI